MTRTQLTFTAAIVALVFIGLTAYGQTDPSTPKPAATDDEQTADEAASQQVSMMDGSMMDSAMMARCRMMSQAEISPSDPAAPLAQRERLNLSEDQVAELERIAQSAREQAKRLLNESQTDELSTLPDKPESMMRMHQRMMKRMNERDASGWANEESVRACPLYNTMLRVDKEQKNRNSQPSTDDDSGQNKTRRMMNRDCCR